MTEPSNQDRTISIAMCTYNGERYLRQQLDSIANQTLLPMELVICDDGSTDSTQEIVADFARSAPFEVKFTRNPVNLGVTKNFEQAIELCSGELIALCDQDDIWMNSKLAQLNTAFVDDTVGGVFSDGILIDERSQTLRGTLWRRFGFTPTLRKEWKNKGPVPIFLRQDIVTGATLIFRKDLRPSLIPISSAWIHDGWIAWTIAVLSRLVFLDIPLVEYRVHSSQQAGVPKATVRGRLAQSLQAETKDFLREASKFEELCSHLVNVAEALPTATVASLKQKIGQCRFRAGLPENRVFRLAAVLSHLAAYAHYSLGMRDAIKDVIRR